MAKLIEILKSNKDKPPPKDWGDLEDQVKHVYQTLLDIEDAETIVARDIQIRGTSGCSHQIDVFYELQLANLTHKVAIECKNRKRSIEKSDVMAFKAILDDCPGLIGAMVTANGYQSGAIEFANASNIKTLTFDDLPSISMQLGMILESVGIPAEKAIGQPFWTFFDVDEAAPYGRTIDGKACGFLFFSKAQAIYQYSQLQLGENWVVRGLTQKHLRTYIFTLDAMNAKFLLAAPGLAGEYETGGGIPFIEIPRSEFIAEFYLGSDLNGEPLVAPRFRQRIT